MKLLFLCSACALIALGASLSHGAAYLKLKGVDGESKADKHEGWIEILSVSGLEDAASGLPTGKRQHKPLTVTKAVDKASPALGGGGGLPPVITVAEGDRVFQLEGVKVVSSQRRGDQEILTLTYASIKARHDVAMNAIRNMKAMANPGSDGDGQPTRAQDYNSSRSNKPSARAAEANHNTTLSNRTR